MDNDAAIRFVLSHTTDPQAAAHLIDRLGVAATELTLRTHLPSSWVAQRQSSPAKIAAFAVANSNDPALLDEIARQTTRQKVMSAIYENPFVTSKTREYLNTRDGFPPASRKARGANAQTIELAQNFIDRVLSAGGPTDPVDINRLRQYLDRYSLPADMLDDLYDRLLPRYKTHELVFSVLASRIGAQRVVGYAPFWMNLPRSSTELLETVTIPERKELLHMLLDSAVYGAYRNLTPARIDLEMMGLFMSYLDPMAALTKTINRTNLRSYQKDLLDYEAFELVRLAPQWRQVLSFHCPTTREIHNLIDETTPDKYMDLLSTYASVPAAVAELLPVLPATARITDYYETRYVLDSIGDSSSALIGHLIDHVSAESLLDFATGKWTMNLAPILPAISELPAIAERCAGLDLALIGSQLGTLARGYTSAYVPRGYLEVLVGIFPGVAQCLLNDPHHSDRIYERLNATGASPELIADQLSLAPAVSLDSLCKTLSALVRVSASN